MKNQTIGFLGDGGQARETRWICERVGIVVMFNALSRHYLSEDQATNLIDIERPSQDQRDTPVLAAAGSPLLRKQLIDTWRGTTYARVIDKSAVIGTRSTVGDGVYVAPGSIITTDVQIGNHALINVGVTVGHNSVIGDYATISPGVHIAGNVKCGEGVFIGIGVSIMNGVSIANGVVIGAGAVVIHDITEENAVFAGVPAKKVNQNATWLKKI